jgi:hypothetical protein
MIDITKSGYNGDAIEEMFKWFTAHNMPFWWHFREVLRASDRENSHWINIETNIQLKNDELKELIGISLLMYQNYTCLAEAISFFEQVNFELNKSNSMASRTFEVKKYWKASYSSLYSSFIALCNLLVVVADKKPVLTNGHNYNVNCAKKISSFNEHITNISNCLEIRHHLDHFWLIWVKINKGVFEYDGEFKKGFLRLNHDNKDSRDGLMKLHSDIHEISNIFNSIYEELSVENGYLDQYLNYKGWRIDYSDYGEPHYGKRPRP